MIKTDSGRNIKPKPMTMKTLQTLQENHLLYKLQTEDFPGAQQWSPPANAGDAGSTPDLRRPTRHRATQSRATAPEPSRPRPRCHSC